MFNQPFVSADESYILAQDFAVSGRLADAIEAYTSAINGDPGHINARCGRGLALQRIGEHERAIDDFDAVISSYQDWPGIYIAFYGRAGSQYALGQYVDAIEDCDDTIRRKPQHTDAIYLRGISLKALGDIEHALEDLDVVLRVDATYREAYYSRGTLFYMMGRWEEAIDDFTSFLRHAATTGEDATNCYRLRGIAAHQLGQHEAALKDLSLAIERDPSSATTYLRRSQVYTAMGDSARAEADFKTGNSLMATG
jgi:tetratricopeptide (TPR) repeat protein